MSEVKAGYVAIVGRPNAGKSTLMNRLMGEKLSIASKKPQTTRKRILGIHSDENHQVVFLDTPGILEPKYLLQKQLVDYINTSVVDADLILFLVDLENDPDGEKTLKDENVRKIIERPSPWKILILNKIDLSNETKIKELIEKFENLKFFRKVIPISAKEGYNIESVMQTILDLIPEHPKFYPDDQLSDATERFFVSEIIREKIFEMFEDEIPYSTEVVIEEFKERDKNKDFISAAVFIERDSQKAILIGKKGAKIKQLGSFARTEIEKFLDRPVYLELRVKVKKDWRSDKNQLKNFGYIQNED